MFRLLLLGLLVLGALVAIEATWNKEARSLVLRVREEKELFAYLRERALDLGEKAVEAARGDDDSKEKDEPEGAAPVAAAPPTDEDEISAEDRSQLDRLIDKKLREDKAARP